ncbi:hypothetical protein Pmani_025644 [Petrolisthes manimaculis]|uniref:Uncharacterized protein n=1 Tax=Petrolisthes manimaculis TaxID=1843537 RepID=A0AAE1U0Y8_9EUCA|nr:hypothetical protein Pmani_025644 [Petrolisthes manimaculis]
MSGGVERKTGGGDGEGEEVEEEVGEGEEVQRGEEVERERWEEARRGTGGWRRGRGERMRNNPIIIFNLLTCFALHVVADLDTDLTAAAADAGTLALTLALLVDLDFAEPDFDNKNTTSDPYRPLLTLTLQPNS